MSNDRHRAKSIPFRCSAEMRDQIAALAAERHLTKAEVMRDLVNLGLVTSGAKVDESYLCEVVQTALADELKPAVERLASICAKTTQIASAAFFMSIWGATRDGTPEDQQAIMEAAAEARRLGIEYLKLAKNRDIDAFIAESAKQMIDE